MKLLTEFTRRSHDFLWGEDLGAVSSLRRKLLLALRTVYAVLRDLGEGQLTLRAMSLVYTTLLSVAPLLALSFSVLKGFGVQNQVRPALLGLLAPLGEKGVEITDQVIGFVNNIKVGVLGALGLGLLIYTVITLLQKIEHAFNFVWRVKSGRPLVAALQPVPERAHDRPIAGLLGRGCHGGVLRQQYRAGRDRV